VRTHTKARTCVCVVKIITAKWMREGMHGENERGMERREREVRHQTVVCFFSLSLTSLVFSLLSSLSYVH
jgi:hypothetical protein